jgi:predicted amidohydrolase
VGIVAAVQIAPVFGDSMASARRAADAIAEVAAAGAWLCEFPESFMPGAPQYADRFAVGSPEFDAHAPFPIPIGDVDPAAPLDDHVWTVPPP